MFFFILKHYLFWQIFCIFLRCENVKSVRVGDGTIPISDVLQKEKIEENNFSHRIYKNEKGIDQNQNPDKVKSKRYLRNQGIPDEHPSSLFFINNIAKTNLSSNGDNLSDDISITTVGGGGGDGYEDEDGGEGGGGGVDTIEESIELSNINKMYRNTIKSRIIEGSTNHDFENRESISGIVNDNYNSNYNNNSNYNSNSNSNNNHNNNNHNNNNNNGRGNKINMMNIINSNEESSSKCETKYKLVDKLKQLNFLYSFVEKSKVMKTINLCTFESYVLCSVTIRNTNNILDVLSTVYGFIPYIFFFLLTVTYFTTFKKNILFLILALGVESIFVEYILKNIIKMKRPDNSAVDSYGMPSGHSAFSLSCIAFIGSYALEERQHDVWSYIVMGLLLPLFLPVPWSRMYIQDHSFSQIMWGSMVGILFGLCCHLLRNRCVKKACDTE